ncbi:MAG: hypothetical protein ACPL7I_00475 [Myxococcota bacterium]
MNIIAILILTYITATLAAISSHRSDFHSLNLPLYSYVMFYTLLFIPLATFMHVFYQGYVFLYFFPDFIISIYRYRLYIAILFSIIYYLVFFITLKSTETNLQNGKHHAVIMRMVFLIIVSIFLFIVLYKRTIFIGTIQDYLSGTSDKIFFHIGGISVIFYIILLFLFTRIVIPRIKRLSAQ